MIKKVIPIILSLCLIFSISIMAANTNDNSNTDTTVAAQNMHIRNGGTHYGEQGSMGTPPQMQNGEMPQSGIGGGQAPDGMPNNTQNTEAEQSEGFIGVIKTYPTPITSVILLILAFVFVFFYKRKQY